MKYMESQTVELKSSIGQLSRAIETLCAFANTDLGTIYFGVDDESKVVGINMSDATFRKVQEAVFNSFDPKIYPNIFKENIAGKTVLVVELKNAPDRPYFVKGRAYKRVGTSNTALSKVEIQRMMYERGNPEFHYDRSPLDAEMSDMDNERIQWFYRRAHDERNLPLEDTPETLNKLNILTDGKPNVAGILAFGHRLPKFFSVAYTQCAVFEGLDKTGRMLDHLNIKGDVFSQIDQAENFVLRNIRKEAEVNNETGRRESHYEVPYRAIREAIANAVAHRDYRISSAVDVAIFDDRIEIWSPGELPQGMTLEKLNQPHKSVLRNGTIAELLYLVRYIEKWGTGIQNIKDWMADYKLPKPTVTVSGQDFIITLKRPVKSESISSTDTWGNLKKELVEKLDVGLVENTWKVLEQIWKQPKITINEIASNIETSTTTVDKHIAKLKHINVLERIGGDKGGVWIIPSIADKTAGTSQ